MLGWKFFCWYIFGNVTCTIRGDAGKSAIIVCILGGGTGRGNGSGTKIGFTLVSDVGLNNCVGCIFGGRKWHLTNIPSIQGVHTSGPGCLR